MGVGALIFGLYLALAAKIHINALLTAVILTVVPAELDCLRSRYHSIAEKHGFEQQTIQKIYLLSEPLASLERDSYERWKIIDRKEGVGQTEETFIRFSRQ